MSGRTLITGGAGFIGTNMAERLLDEGGQVVILDDLSRPGVRRNLAWLKSHARRRQLDVIEGDVRDTATPHPERRRLRLPLRCAGGRDDECP
jgi:CDP-paratose 2-epimerase